MKSQYILNQKKLLSKLEKAIEKNDLITATKELQEIKLKSESYYSTLANKLYLEGKIEEAIVLLKEATIYKPFSFGLTYNLGSLHLIKGDLNESILCFAECIQFAKFDKSSSDIAMTAFNECITFIQGSTLYNDKEKIIILSEAQATLKRMNEKCYPINCDGKSLVGKLVEHKGDTNKGHFTAFYQSFENFEVDYSNRFFLTTEMLPGNITKDMDIKITMPSILPIGKLKSFGKLIIENEDEYYAFEENDLSDNQINYLKYDIGDYKISADDKMFIGDLIPLIDNKKDAQIILNIFVDGLAETVIEKELDILMPRTYEFFKDGYINTNCRTTGDWTLPSVAAMYTGKTSISHGIYHPDLDCKLNKNNGIFTSDFKKAGYFTSQINNDWRITPTYGYLKDMDRILYQHYFGGFKVGQVVGETIEHLETFKHKNHFMWLSVMDLHDVADGMDNDLMTQINTDAKRRQNKQIGITSVLSDYDPNKIYKYKAELKRIDLHLGSLYGYLERTFGKDKIIVSLISDHGQTYLQHDEFLLHEPKRKVPFMLVGKGVPNKISNELSSIIDILPTIAKLTNVKLDSQEGCVLKDFGGEGREISLTETIHPNQPYLVALTDNEHIFRFKTKALTTYNCLIDLEEFTAQLLDINTMEDVSEKYVDKFNKYIDYVIKRASLIQK